MLLGALLDLGADQDAMLDQLEGLGLSPWRLEGKRGAAGVEVSFVVEGARRSWSAAELLDWLESSKLSEPVVRQSTTALRRLVDADCLVRGEEATWDDADACRLLLEIAGFFIGLELLEIEGLYCTRVPIGESDVLNPSPVAAEMLRGAPMRRVSWDAGTLTASGATLLAAAEFVPPKDYTPLRMGYGASGEFALRLSLLETKAAAAPELLMMETHIDDINPQLLGMLPDRLIDRGAVDAWISTMTGKKGRHGFQISVICSAAEQAQLSRFLFSETTTLGVRSWPIERVVLERKFQVIPTPLGPVEVKTRLLPDGRSRSTLEFEAVRRIAEDHGIPVVVAMERLQTYLPQA